MPNLQPSLKHTDEELKELFDKYIKSVLSDKKNKKYAKLTRKAIERHVSDVARSETGNFNYEFNFSRGARVARFVEVMPHVEGNWEIPNLYLQGWQVFFIVCLFGWQEKETGVRRFTDAYMEVARKNAKSTLAAALGLYMLTADGENGPLIICAATTGEQAMKVFRPALRMAKKKASFRQGFDLECLSTQLRCGANGGLMQMVNSDSLTQDGHNPSLVIYDELHAHANRDLYDVLHSSAGSRDNTIHLTITTAGVNYEGVCYELRKLSENTLSGAIKLDHMFALIYTVDDEDDIFEESVWCKANPMLHSEGETKTRMRKKLAQMALEARASQERENEFKRKRLNVWMETGTPYFSVDAWRKKCEIEELPIEKLKRLPCYGGLDLASVRDFSAFSLAWPDYDEDLLYIHTWMWLPEKRLEDMRHQTALPVDDWLRNRYFATTPGDVTDYRVIKKKILMLQEVFAILKILFDPWNATELTTGLFDDGLLMEKFNQSTANYNSVMKAWERRILSGKIKHVDNQLMTWMVGSLVKREDDNQNVAPSKKKSNTNIDGPVSALMATAPVYAEGAVTGDIGDFIQIV